MIDVRLLTTLNVAWTDAELRDRIDSLAGFLADGVIQAECDGDAITAFKLTALGKALLPATTLPWSAA